MFATLQHPFCCFYCGKNHVDVFWILHTIKYLRECGDINVLKLEVGDIIDTSYTYNSD